MKGRKRADRENEIKLPLSSAASGRRLLRKAGFRVTRPRAFEANTIFDTPERRMLTSRSLVRVRQVRGEGELTYKGPPEGGGQHKSRVEIESRVDAGAMAQILEAMGFAPVFRYEKFRTEFARPRESGEAMLDETPVGTFLELEGPPRWVDRTARALGFTPADYITASYGRLYRDACARRNVTPSDMVFPR